MLVVAAWSVCKEGIDIHSEITHQGSHVITKTI